MQLITRDEALAQLQPYRGLEERIFAPTSSYGFVADGSDWSYQFGKKGERVPLADGAWDYAYRLSGLKTASLDRFRKELVTPLVDEAFRMNETELKAVMKDGAIVAFTPAKAEPLDPIQLLKLMERGVGGQKNISGYQVGGDWLRSYITLVGLGTQKFGQVEDAKGRKRGDIIAYGATATASLLGLDLPSQNYPLDISGFTHQLVCTNGMVSAQNVMRFNRAQSKEIDRPEWIQEKTGLVYAAGATDFDRVRALKDVPLSDHTAESLDSIFSQFGIPPNVRGLIARRHINRPAHNMYDLWAHITYVASNYERVLEDPALARRLQMAAGSVVQHHSLCTTCHQLMPKERRLSRSIRELEEETGDTRRN